MRRTGPNAAMRERIWWRDECACVRCGVYLAWPGPFHIHHRRPRGMGGTRRQDANSVANLITLCVDCHTWIESHRAEAYASGWLVAQPSAPALVPCLVQRGSRWAYLGGFAYHDHPAVAA